MQAASNDCRIVNCNRDGVKIVCNLKKIEMYYILLKVRNQYNNRIEYTTKFTLQTTVK